MMFLDHREIDLIKALTGCTDTIGQKYFLSQQFAENKRSQD